MGSKGKLLFDLNEPPVEEGEDGSRGFTVQPQTTVPSNAETFGSLLTPVLQDIMTSNAFFRASSPRPQRVVPSNAKVSDLFVTPGPQGIVNNSAFSHASSVSGFQPFSRIKNAHDSSSSGNNNVCNVNVFASSSKTNKVEHVNADRQPEIRPAVPQLVEKEEGEWSDAEGSADAAKSYNMPNDVKDENKEVVCLAQDPDTNDRKISGAHNSDISPVNGSEATGVGPKQGESRGIDPTQTSRSINNPGKRLKIDQNKETMLGKKRGRQTMFLNLEDVKQTGALKSSTPKRQNFPAPVKTRIVKEGRAAFPSPECTVEKQNEPISGDSMPVDVSSIEVNGLVEPIESRSESNNDINSGISSRLMKINSSADLAADSQMPFITRQNSAKQPMDGRPFRSVHLPSRKPSLTGLNLVDPKLGGKKLPSKKQAGSGNSYQDTSVERLLREVTNENFWHHPEEAELQCVPGRFESVEEYVKVFEPLLFEECRAQLYSSWEELTETVSSHVKVHIKTLERRERGWCDVIVIPFGEQKWTFKEGDVAVLSSPNPGSVRWKRSSMSSVDEGGEPGISGRVAGTVRRHMPLDKREYPGAILHFYIGDSFDPGRSDDDHILNKLLPKGTWYLTVLGSLATTQREYVALHAFRRLNIQMQNAILQPSPDHFPKYEEQTPTVPECFTPSFVEHLHRTFNGPQLAAIQWAATHTAAGTSNGMAKRQDPWPFTLVQGPPGTGKTHTVWGMLNVIHLIQYQHYYTALLKKLAPESYKQANENNFGSAGNGSIDEVLHSMDQNLFRTLPKLCPKPRMLVCAPSNAATDELLARVLDRGFIDGEMKLYRPDVARVGVDSQTRGAQTVSVERRTEQLLSKNRDEIYGWMHQLKAREAHLSQEIARLQRELNFAAATGRSQGSVGVDPDVLTARDQNRDTLLQSLAAVVESRDKTLVEISRLIILEGRFRNASNFNLEEARASLEASFANEAEIVFTTVSSSGRKLFSCLTHGFDMVVIDEAAQASEVAALPPLSLGAARCVLVGDPQQLPATVISKAAGTLLYSRSLFERFQQAGCPTMLLSVQYRMHPQIRQFPSSYFYQGRLTDSESIVGLPDETYYKDPLLRPYIFYDIIYGRESHRGGSVSFQNREEAQFCLRLYEHLQKTIKTMGGVIGKLSVGIITPYKLQLKCLQREFEDVLKSEEGKDIYINTVDAFQGQERDVIIMSCVRASNHGVGFVADIRRMNVALTRARRALWVTGNANALVKSEDWAALIADAKERKCYMDMDSLPKEMLTKAHHPTYPSKYSGNNNRGLRSGIHHNNRQYDSTTRLESRSGTPSEDDEKSSMSSVFRNGSYRGSKLPPPPPLDNSVDDFGQPGDKSRDSRQHGILKKQGPAGFNGKRE